MPTYEYLCKTCGHRFETWQKMSDEPLTVCPNCGQYFGDYRVELQPAGPRQVYLKWARCADCGHVGLREWRFADGPLPNPGQMRERDPSSDPTRNGAAS